MATKKLQIIGNLGAKVYSQTDEPTDATDGSLWLDLDEESFGVNPTSTVEPSDDDIPIATIETWLMNFSRDIYGKRITLKVYKYIRGVVKFANLDEVRKQIDKDVLQIQTFMDDLVAKMKD